MAAETQAEIRRVAVIEIGTSAIRMAIAEGTPDGEIRPLEKLIKSVAIGEDTYSVGRISREKIEQCVRVLRTYQEKLREYRLTDQQNIRVVATSAVREAENTLAFVDRIYIATGLEVQVLDVAEMHRVIYQGVQTWREHIPGLGQDRWVIAEVGGGNTEFLLMQHGEIESSHAIRLGALRLRSLLTTYNAPESQWPELLHTHARQSLSESRLLAEKQPAVKLLALGGEMRFVVEHLKGPEFTTVATKIQLSELKKLTERILSMHADEIVSEYHIPLPDAEMMGPALVANTELAKALNAKQIFVLPATLRHGLLRELIDRDVWSDDLVNQIMRSAIDVGRKYEFDEAHASHVARLTKILFNQLDAFHGLDRRYEMLLVLSALLHEVGLFIGTSSYHKHSMYLITHSELFGLSRRQQMLIASVARYHRRTSPKPTHTSFLNLVRDDRVAVIKMAALLRVALALDAGRNQRIHEFECTLTKQQLIISVPEISDLSMEQLALRQVGGLFEETFGVPIMLRGKRRSPLNRG